MTQIGETDEPKRTAEVNSPHLLVYPSLSPQSSRIPKSSEELREMAKRIAYSVVQGYMEHDRGHLEKSVEGFFHVYRQLFPRMSPLRTRRAAELYVEALVKQDEIENTPGYSPDIILMDPRWDEVKTILVQFSRELGLPDSYSDETTNFFRHHGVRNSLYVNYLLESDRIFTTAVLGDQYWSKILGPLYMILVDCHDKHDSVGLEVGLQFAEKYFEIILRAKTAQSDKVIAPEAWRRAAGCSKS